MNTFSISRRKFAQLLGAGAACAIVKPAFTFAEDPIATEPASSAVVRLSSNENPYGPAPKALQAMTDAFGLACRYPDEHAKLLEAQGALRAFFDLLAAKASLALAGDPGERARLLALIPRADDRRHRSA